MSERSCDTSWAFAVLWCRHERAKREWQHSSTRLCCQQSGNSIFLSKSKTENSHVLNTRLVQYLNETSTDFNIAIVARCWHRKAILPGRDWFYRGNISFLRQQRNCWIATLSSKSNVVCLKACPSRPLTPFLFIFQESCARTLLFRGADKDALNYAGQTPYQVYYSSSYPVFFKWSSGEPVGTRNP